MMLNQQNIVVSLRFLPTVMTIAADLKLSGLDPIPTF